MHAASIGWAAIYYASTAASLAILYAVAMIVVENFFCLDHSDAYPWLGAAVGALLGLWFAWGKRNCTTTHRVLRIVGVSLGLLGLVGGVVMSAQRQQRDHSGVLLAGLEELLMALFAFAVAGIGAFLWLAGVSGRRNTHPIASSGGVPIP